ncbi:protein CLT3, chloroplastic-like [Iris pallida]|uniref:Protein CLT3, chloroplastic-like n=1 Tax=Iris pallida TaxID=29817 RepID=A0AAX6GAB2_IRIPA|nr:protein CLT3, chloroplastic-like [Iris pallida]
MYSCYHHHHRAPSASVPTPSDRRLRCDPIRPISLSLVRAGATPPSLRSRFPIEPGLLRFDGGRRGLERNFPAVACGSALGERIGGGLETDRRRRAEVAAAAAVTVVLGTGNRVLYKLALVPLKNYPFFLAQLATFGYVVVYFSVLYFRYHAGIVTDEMLSLPKTPFLAVGLLEALAAASGMAAGAVLSGASIPIISQTFLIWQLLLSIVFLGRRYRRNQILGCFLVAVGVVITVASGADAGLLQSAGLFWTLLMMTSFLFQAADTVLKEVIFLNAAKQLKGGSVDLFVVNSFGSAFQAMILHRHCLYVFYFLYCQSYGGFPSANYQHISKMEQPAFLI